MWIWFREVKKYDVCVFWRFYFGIFLFQNRGIQSRATIEKSEDSKSQESCSKINGRQGKKLSQSSVSSHDRDKENGEDEEKSESESEEEIESSSSAATDKDDRQIIVGNEEKGDESECEGDTGARCEQEGLDLLKKKERSNVT